MSCCPRTPVIGREQLQQASERARASQHLRELEEHLWSQGCNSHGRLGPMQLPRQIGSPLQLPLEYLSRSQALAEQVVQLPQFLHREMNDALSPLEHAFQKQSVGNIKKAFQDIWPSVLLAGDVSE